ncbi:hypothetical protein FLW53_23460 [Microbispora sp. SCL1-1]|uniref:hypothetical protein n=1 Tax=unclassified Microbispora TaxID=2614687 RepID=UPI001159CD14|nr:MULTISPECIES: hypothetical protein [unclassified Microbispora]NJP27103.1 hypothetical protein [Microbispora sp. CL1-1]TQS11448.1 hypothetical protein FLW53_23460 [Microbispora sp. SCL1-1]
MALLPLAEPADLAVRLRTTFEDGSPEELAAEALIEDASAQVRSATGQHIYPVETDTVELTGGDRLLNLPQWPVIVDDDHPLVVVEYDDYCTSSVTLVEGLDYVRHGHQLIRSPGPNSCGCNDGAIRRGGGNWAERVVVTYTHGLAEVPPEVRAVVLNVAMRGYVNPGALRSRTLGSYSETFTTETVGTGELTDSDMRRLARAGWAVRVHSVRSSRRGP